tara:strand:- start:3948 stop:4526 length:579 start_codon:yes stop_codon:yes gene_type:complete
MNRVIQLILFFILVIIIFIFYNEYFKIDDRAKIENTISVDKPVNSKDNSLIKNLKYEISISEDNDYQIMSELSKITYKDGAELILMQNVNAILTDENGNSVFVTSDNASYNNANYNTEFKNNIKIKYLDSVIFAEKMILDFKGNFISIYNNVRYNGSLGNLEADNIKINLITKKIDIFMNNANENVVISSNE